MSESDPKASKDSILNPRNRGLGRGLSALFDDDESDVYSEKTEDSDKSMSKSHTKQRLSISKLKPSPFQPRKDFSPAAIEDLATSIEKHGVLQPILVRVASDDTSMYEIIAGERRWRASQKAGLHEVPVIIQELDDLTTLEIALIENLQREDLNPLEEADAYQRLMAEFEHTQESLAESLGKSRSYIANSLRLLNLPDSVKAYVISGRISAGHARAILGADDPQGLADEVVSKNLSVRATEKRAAEQKTQSAAPASSTPKKGQKSVDVRALEDEMSNRLGTKVEITVGKKGGKLIVHYKTIDQLDGFLHSLGK